MRHLLLLPIIFLISHSASASVSVVREVNDPVVSGARFTIFSTHVDSGYLQSAHSDDRAIQDRVDASIQMVQQSGGDAVIVGHLMEGPLCTEFFRPAFQHDLSVRTKFTRVFDLHPPLGSGIVFVREQQI